MSSISLGSSYLARSNDGITDQVELAGFLPLVLEVAGSRVAVARVAKRRPVERTEVAEKYMLLLFKSSGWLYYCIGDRDQIQLWSRNEQYRALCLLKFKPDFPDVQALHLMCFVYTNKETSCLFKT
jgi:hypothetical protein